MPPITKSDLQPAEQSRVVYSLPAPRGTTLGEIQRPDFWTHVASTLRITDRVEVFPVDGSFWADLLVIEVSGTIVRVKLINSLDLTPEGDDKVQPPAESLYKLVYAGPREKHCVVRIADGVKLASDFPSKTEANKWLLNYESEQLR